MIKKYFYKPLLLTLSLLTFLFSFAEDYFTQQELNVRSGAGASYSILGVIKNGSTIDVSEINGKWATIKYEGQTGYVSTKFISKSSSTEQSASLSKSESSGGSTKTVFFVIGAIGLLLAIRFVSRRASELLGVKGEENYKYRCKNCGRYSTRRGHIYKCNSGEHEWFQL